jgi:hypothetical protein
MLKFGTRDGWTLPVLAITSVSALGMGSAVVHFDGLPFLVMIGSLLVVIGLRRPKLFILVALAIIVFSPSAERWFGGGWLSLLDEAFVAMALLLALIWRYDRAPKSRARFPGIWFFSAFLVIGAVSSHVHDVPLFVAGQGALLATKGIAFGWSVAQAHWDKNDVVVAVRIGGVAACVFAICGLANLAAPTAWSALFNNLNVSGTRYGLLSISGPFVHPAAFGRMMALLALGALAYRSVFGSSRLSSVVLSATMVGTFASLRRKSIAGLIVSGVYIRYSAARLSTLAAVVIVTPVLLIGLWHPLGIVFFDLYEDYVINEAARTRITVDSVEVASRYFPLGAGFGRFGSSVAREVYSPEYIHLGYQNVFGLGARADNGMYLTDTQWPAIVGEAGWIGGMTFVLGLVAVLLKFRALRRSDSRVIVFLGVLGVSWVLLFLVESVASPVFSSAPTYPLLFGLIGVAAALGVSGTGCAGETGLSPGAVRRRRVR